MGTTRGIIAEGTEGPINYGLNDLIVYSGSCHKMRRYRVDRIEDREIMHGEQVQLVMGEHRTEWGMLFRVKLAQENKVVLDEEQLLFLAGGLDNAIDEDVDEQPVQDLALNVDNIQFMMKPVMTCMNMMSIVSTYTQEYSSYNLVNDELATLRNSGTGMKDGPEFDLKSALFKHMNKNKTANRNPANYHLYHALMEALIADEDAMDKEVAVKIKDHKRKHDSDDDEDDDDDEGPSAGSNQGSLKKLRKSDASASKQHPALTSTGLQITDIRDDVVNSSMPRSDTESEHFPLSGACRWLNI
ncbi:hypothetical protein Tco_0600905 [Tanacetum coccineum]